MSRVVYGPALFIVLLNELLCNKRPDKKLSTRRVEDGRGGFRLSVAIGVSFDVPVHGVKMPNLQQLSDQ